jgi:alkylation response protein AidB-like acyl-CoA dehydrogenase
MDFAFSEEQEMLRASVRDFLASDYPLEKVAQLADSDSGWDPESWRGLVELGWVGISVAEAAGGTGMTFLEEAVIFEEMGRGLYAGPFFSTVGLALPVLELAQGLAPDALRAVLGGRRTLTLAGADAGGVTSIAGATATRAEPSGSGWRLHGAKALVPDAAIVDDAIVAARTADGLGLWLVDLGGDGVTVTPRSTMDGTRRFGDITFDGVEAVLLVPPGSADEVLARVRRQALAALACEAVGIAQRALEISRDHARQREQFGRVIGTYQGVSHRIANIYVSLELARSLAYWAAWSVSVDSAEAELAVAAAKSAAGEAAVFACENAIQSMGGIGFTWENPLHRLYKRAQSIDSFEGHGRIQRAEIAARLLDGGGQEGAPSTNGATPAVAAAGRAEV